MMKKVTILGLYNTMATTVFRPHGHLKPGGKVVEPCEKVAPGPAF